MQFYAVDESKKTIHATLAKKHLNYSCLECGSTVRLRGGLHRRLHFYHSSHSRTCQLNSKSMIHLQLQCYIAALLPANEAKLEQPFPAICRIADVAWPAQKLVFEIQCSPISNQELKQRNQDYQKEGWSVIWILHEQRYNQKFLSSAEIALQKHTHYFSNMDAKGKGMIYDQFALIGGKKRLFTTEKLPVDLSRPLFFGSALIERPSLQLRAKTWSHYFAGDLFEQKDTSDGKQATALEICHLRSKNKQKVFVIIKRFLHALFIRPYRALFHYILEKSCH